MRRPRPAALLASGNAAADPLLRLLSAAGSLGPVGSTSSLRVASRIARTLHAGEPVRSVAQFEPCRLVLVYASGEALGQAVRWLRSAEFDWRRRTVLILGAENAHSLEPLAARGACTGVIAPMPGFEGRWFVLKGDRRAAREIRSMLAKSGARLAIIPPASGLLFDAALTLSGAGAFALMAAADAALVQAGLPRSLGDPVLEKSFERAVRSWMNARGQGWGGYLDAGGLQHMERQIAALDCTDPRTATFLRRVTEASRDFMSR